MIAHTLIAEARLIGKAPRTDRGIQCVEERDNGRQPLRTRERIENGALQHGDASDLMRAFNPGPDPDARLTATIIGALADNLDANTFGSASAARSYDVIDGGKSD